MLTKYDTFFSKVVVRNTKRKAFEITDISFSSIHHNKVRAEKKRNNLVY